MLKGYYVILAQWCQKYTAYCHFNALNFWINYKYIFCRLKLKVGVIRYKWLKFKQTMLNPNVVNLLKTAGLLSSLVNSGTFVSCRPLVSLPDALYCQLYEIKEKHFKEDSYSGRTWSVDSPWSNNSNCMNAERRSVKRCFSSFTSLKVSWQNSIYYRKRLNRWYKPV